MGEAEKVKIYFERASQLFNSVYTEEMSPVARFFSKILRRDLKARFTLTLNEIQEQKPRSLLDVGVGPGQYLKAYLELGVPEITGLDFSLPMIELAKKQVGNSTDSGRITYIVADFMRYEFKCQYDIVVAMGVFDYVEDQTAFLRKMRGISNKCVIASFPSISIWRTPLRKLRYFFKRCPVHFYTPDLISRFSREAGFRAYYLTKIRGSGMDYWVRFDI